MRAAIRVHMNDGDVAQRPVHRTAPAAPRRGAPPRGRAIWQWGVPCRRRSRTERTGRHESRIHRRRPRSRRRLERTRVEREPQGERRARRRRSSRAPSLPPCASAHPRTSVSPRPHPRARASAPRERLNGSKSRACSSGGMPGPALWTEIAAATGRTADSRRRPERPAAPCFSAFVMRFQSARVSWSGAQTPSSRSGASGGRARDRRPADLRWTSLAISTRSQRFRSSASRCPARTRFASRRSWIMRSTRSMLRSIRIARSRRSCSRSGWAT